MALRNPLIVPDLRELMQGGESAGVREFLADHHPAQVAEIIEDLEPKEGDALLGLLDERVRAEVLSYLEPESQVRVVEAMSPGVAAALLHLMPHDDRADLVRRLDEDHVEEILRGLAQTEREDIRRLVSYEPGTAGAVMTTDYATLPPNINVLEANARIRQQAPDRETINYLYVIDGDRRLVGVVTLRSIFLARPSARIGDIMSRDLIVARVDEDQEQAAQKIEEYDLIAIPVVDADDRLLGIVTHDDAADILRKEEAEDALRFAGVAADAETDDTSYWHGHIRHTVRRRVVWLLLLFGGGFLTSYVVRSFQWVDSRLSSAIDLAAFIPLLIGTGGNAGSQSVGTIIRGLAVGDIQSSDALRVMLREALTGLFLGLLLGAIGFCFTWLQIREPRFSLVIALALIGICIWATTVGALVPLLARKFGIDPAVVSAPLISTLVDATGLVIYYVVAIALLIRIGS